LELAFQQLKEKLGRAGFFDVDRKRPLPAYPRTIAVVTSLTGAAIRDILQTIARRYPKIRIFVFGVRVQGEGSSEDIAGAIRRINCARASLGGIDAIIAGRGGGSIEDLWAFNSEAVARAIYDSQIPVVSAVGHEVDFTIADFVADVRAATPTAAAELVVPVLADVLHNFAVFEHRLRHAMRRRMETTRLRLSSVERVSWFRDPSTQVRRLHQGIDEIVGRLKLAKARRLNKLRSRLHQLETRMMQSRPSVQLAKRQSRLERISRHLFRGAEAVLRRKGVRARGMEIRMASLSPRRQFELGVLQLSQLGGRLDRAMSRYFQDQTGILASLDARLRASGYEQVLRRGFTITRRVRDGQVIRSAVETRPDDFVLTQTADGQFRSRVVDELPSEIFDA
ncbi:MAG TPA: exodeoxyribonuclease VII large subunit, partial [Phycisphaerae bacterium]|nr:exodeoxyribonuclease VII large subunit [Phycisphaerae bacterium]